MGLDVYLRRSDDWEGELTLQQDNERKREIIWDEYGPYENMTQENKDEAHKRVQEIDAEEVIHIDDIRQDSQLYPEHMYKVGYFRSSYNSSGVNQVMQRLGIFTLYDIFPHDEDVGYEFMPDWNFALDRVNVTIDDLKAKMQEEDVFDVMDINHNMFITESELPHTEQAAIRAFEKVRNQGHSFEMFSTREGSFMLDGLTIFGAIPGIGTFNRPTVYLVYKKESSDLDWYLQAFEIVREAIQFVLGQDKPETYWLAWSG